MKKEKQITVIIGLVILMIIEFILIKKQLYSYSIILMAALIILYAYLLSIYYETKDEDSIYKSKLKKALKNYDAILVESKKFPDLNGKNIITVTNLDDLIDAQIEIRKPIYYMIEGEESCSFVLLDNNEACVYILKKNEKVVSPLELIIEEYEDKKYKKNNEESLLEDIDKTTIIKLNSKILKVSPYRKEENKEEQKTQAKKHKNKNKTSRKEDNYQANKNNKKKNKKVHQKSNSPKKNKIVE